MLFIFQADFGILFDVDGVLARGSTPLNAAVQAIRHLEDESGQLKVPVAFVTNACNRSHDKAAQIQKWLNIQVSTRCIIHTQLIAGRLSCRICIKSIFTYIRMTL